MNKRGVFNFLWAVLIITVLGVGLASLNYYGSKVQMAPNQTDYACYDSDGGKFPDVPGTVSGVFAGTKFSYKDSCVGGSVKEYYCTTNYKGQPIGPPPITYPCANGCSVNANREGYCNPKPIPLCGNGICEAIENTTNCPKDCPAPVFGNNATIKEGETKTLSYNGVNYTVSIVFISTNQVKLNVNGNITDVLAEGNSYVISSGVSIFVDDIIARQTTGAPDSVAVRVAPTPVLCRYS